MRRLNIGKRPSVWTVWLKSCAMFCWIGIFYGRRSAKRCAILLITNADIWQWRNVRCFRLPRAPCDRKIGRRSTRSGTTRQKHCSTPRWKRNVTHCETGFCAGVVKITRTGSLIGTKSPEWLAMPVSPEPARSFNEAVETKLLRGQKSAMVEESQQFAIAPVDFRSHALYSQRA